MSHFIKSRLSSLSIKQRNRNWVTLRCKREELRTSNEMAHFHRNSIFLCLVYHFQIWKSEFTYPWEVYTSQHFIQSRALMVLFCRHSTCWICPMKSSICGCFHCYRDAYKICLESQLGKNYNTKSSCHYWQHKGMAIFIFK